MTSTATSANPKYPDIVSMLDSNHIGEHNNEQAWANFYDENAEIVSYALLYDGTLNHFRSGEHFCVLLRIGEQALSC